MYRAGRHKPSGRAAARPTIFIQEAKMRSVARWTVIVALMAGSLAARPADAVVRAAPRAQRARVVWLKLERVPAARRLYLTHLLMLAVEGRPIRGSAVRDSRPEISAVDLNACGTLAVRNR